MTAHDDAFSERECWELLATVTVGRLALSVRALPVILPVQYYLDGRRLAACLGHHGLPERALDETIVAFAADSIDPVTRSGWSVEVQGRSVIPRGLRIDAACDWPSPAAQVVEIEPGKISGYRMHLCPFIDTLLARRPAVSPPASGPRGLGQKARCHQAAPPPGRRDRKT